MLFLIYTTFYSMFIAIEAIRTVAVFFEESDAMVRILLSFVPSVKADRAPNVQTEVGFPVASHFILILMSLTFTLSIGGFAIYHIYLAW